MNTADERVCDTCGRATGRDAQPVWEVGTRQVVSIECGECVHALGTLLRAGEARVPSRDDRFVRFHRGRVGAICELEEWDLTRIDAWVEFMGGEIKRHGRPPSTAVGAGRRLVRDPGEDEVFWSIPANVLEEAGVPRL